MTKKYMIEACDNALNATADANNQNDCDSHNKAASLHRIAAEHCKLMGDDATHEKHKGMAVEHDLCSSRCSAAKGNKVNVPEQTATEIEARKQLQAEDEMEASKARVTKLNELSAKRMSDKAPLMASLAGAGYSLNDLQSELRERLQKIPSLNKSADSPNSICNTLWACDIICPEEEAGETWSAIVQGCDGKLYAVNFTVGNEVAIVGEPKEVERTTGYDYVGAMETEAKAALTVAPLEAAGTSAGAGKGVATKKAISAEDASTAANSASEKADASKLKDDHTAAKDAHQTAFDLHRNAFRAHVKADADDETVDKHRAAMDTHKAAMAKHVAAMECEDADDSMTAKVHRCHAALKACGANPSLSDVRMRMFREHKVCMTNSDVARELTRK